MLSPRKEVRNVFDRMHRALCAFAKQRMTRFSSCETVLFVVLDLVQWAPADTTTNLVTEDSWIHGLADTTPRGTGTDLRICPLANYWIYLKFDLSSITGFVTDAELRMSRFGGRDLGEKTGRGRPIGLGQGYIDGVDGKRGIDDGRSARPVGRRRISSRSTRRAAGGPRRMEPYQRRFRAG